MGVVGAVGAVLSEEPVHAPEQINEVTLSMQIGGKALCFPAVLRSHTRIDNRERFGFELEDFAPFIAAIEAMGKDVVIERRAAPRVAIGEDEDVLVELRNAETEAVLKGHMMDLSIQGACVDVEEDADAPVAVGDRVVVAFDLPGEDQPFSMACEVTRRVDSFVALRFEAEQESLEGFVARRLRASKAA